LRVDFSALMGCSRKARKIKAAISFGFLILSPQSAAILHSFPADPIRFKKSGEWMGHSPGRTLEK
jgi:hypothetical protein